MSELNMHCVVAKFVPKILILGQKVEQQVLDDPTFMSRVITGNKTWTYSYHSETK